MKEEFTTVVHERKLHEVNLTAGGFNPLWWLFSESVGRFVEKARPQKLLVRAERMEKSSVAPEKLEQGGVVPPIVLRPHEVYGGIRVPHLHHGGEIYLLTSEQWKEFSNHMLSKLTQCLRDANSVSFDQLMDISSSVASL